MKVLITGANGQLGHDVSAELDKRHIENRGIDIEDLDITKKEDVACYISDFDPDVVVHCAAYTAVDKAEDEPEKCEKINFKGTENIALACKENDAAMLYISTDYVFDGASKEIWSPEDEPDPGSVYGRTKYQGEQTVRENLEKHFIIRIAWAFGKNGNNFVKTMLDLGRKNIVPKVVDDQFGSPTYTRDLAVLIADMIGSDKYGTYHATNEGFCTWHEFASEIFKKAKMDIKPIPCKTEDYPFKAKRPKNSRLSKDKLTEKGFKRLPPWQDALDRYMNELEEDK